MLKTKPINMSVIEKDDELGFSRLELNFKGEDINRITINSIKRITTKTITIALPIIARTEKSIYLTTEL